MPVNYSTSRDPIMVGRKSRRAQQLLFSKTDSKRDLGRDPWFESFSLLPIHDPVREEYLQTKSWTAWSKSGARLMRKKQPQGGPRFSPHRDGRITRHETKAASDSLTEPPIGR
jgi:hypothetical protein